MATAESEKRMSPFKRIICELVDVFMAFKVEKVLTWIISFCLYLVFKLRNNFTIVGLKNVPRNKNFLLVGNHSSAMDAYLVAGAITGRLFMRFWYVANASWRFDDPFFSRLMRLSGAIPRRGTGAQVVQRMVGVLVDPRRRRMAIPPEGTFNTNGKIMHGFTGVARVYYEANKVYRIPILPVVSIGAAKAYPADYDSDGVYRPKKRQGIIGRIGKPFHLPEPPNGVADKEFLRVQTESIMERLRRLAMQKEPLADNEVLRKLQQKFQEKARVYEY
jgi:1-acyl-sn-glycerol-3-phosphate acyltransferase